MSKPKKPMDLPVLVDYLLEVTSKLAVFKAKAQSRGLPLRMRRVLWAQVRDTERRAWQSKVELMQRIGHPICEDARPMAVYAASKVRRVCEDCGDHGGMNNRFLHWLVGRHGLAYQQAKSGAAVETIKQTITHSKLYCVRCGKKRGAQFDKLGRPLVVEDLD